MIDDRYANVGVRLTDRMIMRRHPQTTFEAKRVDRVAAVQAIADGWRFEAGWFRRASGLEWAWFSREVDESEEKPQCK